jgi:hypothetical protein
MPPNLLASARVALAKKPKGPKRARALGRKQVLIMNARAGSGLPLAKPSEVPMVTSPAESTIPGPVVPTPK